MKLTLSPHDVMHLVKESNSLFNAPDLQLNIVEYDRGKEYCFKVESLANGSMCHVIVADIQTED